MITDYNFIDLNYIANPDRIKTYVQTNVISQGAEDLYNVIQNPSNIIDKNNNNYIQVSGVNLYSPYLIFHIFLLSFNFMLFHIGLIKY